MKKQQYKTSIYAIDAAETCIKEHGIQGVNARHIAKTIGCSVGTLYNLFKNIDFIILEANLRTLSRLDTALNQASEQANAGDDAIQAIATAYIHFAMQNKHAWQALFEHRMPEDTKVPQAYYQQRQQLFHHVEKHLAISHPNISPQRLALESRALWAGIHGICILTITNKFDDDDLSIEDIASTLVQHFLAGAD